MSEPKAAEEQEAIRRIGVTADGYLLRRFLQRHINTVAPLGAKGGALRESEGRRRFALELRALLDQDAPSAGTASDRSGKPDPDEPFRVQRAQPVALASAGPRRRVADYDDKA